MKPSVTLSTLHNDCALTVVHQADGARGEAGTGSTLGVIVLPLTSQTWCCGSTLSTCHTPLALPALLRHILQRRVQAIRVIADVTVVT